MNEMVEGLKKMLRLSKMRHRTSSSVNLNWTFIVPQPSGLSLKFESAYALCRLN